MRIIFSRKGIDSSFGSFASPILPDGSLCWLPIPEDSIYKPGLPTYNDILFRDTTLGTLIESLSSGRILGSQTIHLDPDIFDYHRSRHRDWRPLFGQTGAAESHLRNHKVSVGDLFLFFGWFKQTFSTGNGYKYDKKAQDLHVIYGWFQIGDIVKVKDIREIEPWMQGHPHLLGTSYSDSDTIYFPSRRLSIDGLITEQNGSGFFPYLTSEITLTAPQSTRSIWSLPSWFFPGECKPALSYNEDASRWKKRDGSVLLRVASRGQEFILDTESYPESLQWAYNLIKSNK